MSLPESELRKLFDACAATTQSILHDQVDKGLDCIEEIAEGVNAGDIGFEIRVRTVPDCSVQLLAYLPNGELRLLGRYMPTVDGKKIWIN
jgi:hypothetical protein